MTNLPQVKTSSLAVELTCLDLIKILSANPLLFYFFIPVVKPLKMTSRVLNIEGSFHYILKSHQSTFSSSVCMDMYQNMCGLHFAEGYDELYFEDVAHFYT